MSIEKPSQAEHSKDGVEALFDELRAAKDLPERKVLVDRVYARFETWLKENGGSFEEDVGSVYRAIEHEQGRLLVRQELLQRLFTSFAQQEPLLLNPEHDGRRFANAATWGSTGEGAEIAFSEGRAAGQGITTLISFDPTGLDVQKIPPSECDLRDRTLCRSVVGALPISQVRHVVIRIPRTLFPEDHFTDGEENSETRYIFRGAFLK